MNYVIVFISLLLVSCSNTVHETSIKLINGSDIYNSYSSTLTRHYCDDEITQKTVKVYLSKSQLDKLMQAALLSYQQSLIVDDESGENLQKMCVSSYPFELELYQNGEAQLIGQHSCFGISVLDDAIDEIIYKNRAVKKLKSSRCRYY